MRIVSQYAGLAPHKSATPVPLRRHEPIDGIVLLYYCTSTECRPRAAPFGRKVTRSFARSVRVVAHQFRLRLAMPILSMRLAGARRGGSWASVMGRRACSPRVPLATTLDGDRPASRG